MAVYKSNKPTKDKRTWFFAVYYDTLKGERKKYASKLYLTKKEAEEEQSNFKISTKDKRTGLTFNDLCEDYMNYITGRLKDNSVYKIKGRIDLHIKPYFGNMKVQDLTKNKYIDWQNMMNKTKLSPSYKNTIHGLLVSIIKHGVKYDRLIQNIPQMVGGFKDDEVREINFFTYDEFEKFISVIDDLEHKLLFTMLYYLGLRKGELQALTWNDILSDTIAVKKTAVENVLGKRWVLTSPKTKSSVRSLKVPIKIKIIRDELYKEKIKFKNFNTNFFVFGDFQPICNTTLARIKNNYCKQAGVKQIRIHDFRHSTASLLISKGMDIVKVADYLGHSDKATTLNIYSHMYPDDKNRIADMIDSF